MPRFWGPSESTGFCFSTSIVFVNFFFPLQTLMGSQGGSLHSAGQTLLPLVPGVILGPVWPEKSVFPPRGQELGGAGLRQKHLSQFSPAAGKRLAFPWSSSLLIPVFSSFPPSCFTFALAERIYCSASPRNNFCPRSSGVSLVRRGLLTLSGDRCLSGLGLAANPKLQLMPTATSAFGQGGCTHQLCTQKLWLLFDFTGKRDFPKLLLS